jgi:hypothetical protein
MAHESVRRVLTLQVSELASRHREGANGAVTVHTLLRLLLGDGP